jgi:multidrug resistance efflux pump
LNLREGATVRRGDVLIQLDTVEAELKKRSLESRIHFVEERLRDLQRRLTDNAIVDERAVVLEAIEIDASERVAQANLEQAQLRFTRAGALFASGLISRQAMDESRIAMSQAEAERFRLTSRSIDLKSAQSHARLRDAAAEALPLRAEVASLRAQLEQNKMDYGKLTITSPSAGQLTLVAPLHVNELLSAGTTIAALVPAHGSLIVEAWLPTADRHFVVPGQSVRLQTDSFPPDQYDRITGTVRFISPDATFNEARVGAYRVLIAPSPHSPRLSLGMTSQAHFITRQEPVLGLLFQKIRQELGK